MNQPNKGNLKFRHASARSCCCCDFVFYRSFNSPEMIHVERGKNQIRRYVCIVYDSCYRFFMLLLLFSLLTLMLILLCLVQLFFVYLFATIPFSTSICPFVCPSVHPIVHVLPANNFYSNLFIDAPDSFCVYIFWFVCSHVHTLHNKTIQYIEMRILLNQSKRVRVSSTSVYAREQKTKSNFRILWICFLVCSLR